MALAAVSPPEGRAKLHSMAQRGLLGVELIDPSFLSGLKPLKAGAEAAPFSDETHGVVYKLFSPDPQTAHIGWKLKSKRVDGKWETDRDGHPTKAGANLQRRRVAHGDASSPEPP